MTLEELLLADWRSLPVDKQRSVVDFVKFLKNQHGPAVSHSEFDRVEEYKAKAVSELGQQLQAIQAEIVASGEPLLDWEGIEREKAERRGGYQGDVMSRAQ